MSTRASSRARPWSGTSSSSAVGACRLRAVESLLFGVVQPHVPILPYDELAADWHARERVRLAAQPPPFADGQIASIAATRDLTLVTANVADFERFEGLRVEDWTREV